MHQGTRGAFLEKQVVKRLEAQLDHEHRLQGRPSKERSKEAHDTGVDQDPPVTVTVRNPNLLQPATPRRKT